jgi:septum site-determining protein MinC
MFRVLYPCKLVFGKGKMDKGYIENGFIVDLTNAKKTSEIIYELSRILDMPEAKEKHICLKLGSVDLSENELLSVKALVELMNSQLAFISTSSTQTLEAAAALDIKISEFTNKVEAPVFEEAENPTKDEMASALDHIFGEDSAPETSEQKVEESSEKEISPIVRNDDITDEKVQELEAHEESDEEIVALKNEAENLPTLYLRKTIRSGQSISSDGNLVIIGDVNPGAEVIAKGDITVWGILGGIAHAGSEGNNYAKIRALKLNPVQIRIGEIFARRPDTINLPYIQKSCEYIPEEAFTYKGSIVIRKIHDEI